MTSNLPTEQHESWLSPLPNLLDKETFLNNSKLLIALALLVGFRIITLTQRDSLKVYYSKSSDLMRGLIENSKIKGMTYVPHTLALNGHMQAFLLVVCNFFLSFFFSIKYE